MKIGAHLSRSGGFGEVVFKAKDMGLNCLQIFGSSPRQWQVKYPSEKEAKEFRESRKKAGIREVYLHAAYLVNLASPEKEVFDKSVRNLAAHLKIAEELGADGLIFHIGSGKELPKSEAIKRVAEGARLVLSEVPGETRLILENSAGGGQKLGSFPEEIAEIVRAIGSQRVAVCFDTAHALEAGLVLDYSENSVKNLIGRWEESIGWNKTPVIHANDSKTAPDSHRDQHENIGAGFIGPSGFKKLVAEPLLRDKAWILEVPGFDGNGPDRKNVELLQQCFT